MKRKLCLLLLMLLPLLAIAQQQRFSETFTNEKLESVLQTIKKKTGVKFVYNTAVVKNAERISAKAENETVKGFLDRILPKLKLEGSWQNDVYVIRSPQKGKLIHVYGVVTDYNNDPLPGVSIRGRDSNIHAVTDADGNYHITATEQEVLSYKYIGMKEKIVVCDRANIDVKMMEDTEYLNDVVVIGYQDVDRSKLTSSVTSLKMEDIKNPGLTTIDKMLEGHVPGMIYMQNSGQVGSTPKIRIRGTSTLVGNREPVWVLDGIVLNDPVPVDPNNLNDPDFVNLLGNAISGLNPNDIDEINVLKDASATALYGAKAGNGVIVITTKKGKVGAPSVTYNGTMTYTRRPRYSDRDVYMMTSAERLDVSKELIERGMYYNNVTQWSGYEQALQDYYAGKIDFDEYHRLTNYYSELNTDWFKLLTRDVVSHNHTASISGGSPTMRYYASLGYGDEGGVIKGESNKRYNATVNLNANYKKVSINFQLLGNYQKHDYLASGINVMDYAYNMSRTMPAYGTDGELFYYPINNSFGNIYNYNILNELDNSGNQQLTNNVNLRTRLRYELLQCLNLDGIFSYGISNTTQEEFYTADTKYIFDLRADRSLRSDLCPLGGQLKREETRNNNWMARLQANFMKNFGANNQHLLTASAGVEATSTEYKGFAITRRGYFREYGGYFDYVPTDYAMYYQQFMASDEGKGKRTRNLQNELAYYGTVGYGFRDTYIFNVHMRAERSNLFGTRANDEFSPIWSVSGRWNMKKDILRKVDWVTDVALRASWGY
ncbi:MAG: SusC/RagA family TonB-linked outer membrane protein, partial [Prevotella sp.]|nr:SusC/RagA family TonB-linked outer membrane protein [Prevotella sp.]